MKKVLFIVLGLLVVVGAGYLAYAVLNEDEPKQDSSKTVETNESPQTEETETSPAGQESADFAFDQPKKAAHYVSNIPEHGAVLDAVPGQVAITFNFDLSPDSTVTVTKDGQPANIGVPAMSDDSLVLSQQITSDLGPGLYTVMYSACWPDGSCHDGQFQFGVE